MLKSGNNFNIAITVYGEVYSWGCNFNGQLGLSHYNDQKIPQLMEFFKDKQIKEMKCSYYHTIVITRIGEVYSWGFNNKGQLGLGYNGNQNIPQQIDFFKDRPIKEIICGEFHAFAITEIGDLYSWGYNYFGELGLSHNNNHNVPQLVDFFKNKQIKQIKCGSYHTIAITENGDVYSWGRNYDGELGLGHNYDQNIPQQMDFFKNKPIKKIVCGRHHIIVITEIGDVYSWGNNEEGQLGLGNNNNHNIPQQIEFFKDKQIKKIKCGNFHTFTITHIGEVYSWGYNHYGQLGLGYNNSQNVPQQIDFFKDKQIKKIICGAFYTFAITEIGEVYSWGCNNYGQLGLAHNDNQNIPQQVYFFREHPIIRSKIKSARSTTFNS